ncbi:MAG: rod shape-determining protein MreC, partial [Undibacterium sp.]|nr:rod shape-determining protein MreC [Undibacterium sp.]
FSISLLLVDSRLNSLLRLRQVLATTLYPLQMLALTPRDALTSLSNYFASTSALEKEVAQLKQQQLANALVLHKSNFLATENAQLRQLAELKQRTATPSLTAEILYDARDEVTRKIIINKGLKHGLALSQPVIDERGVIGQVTRVFPLTAEVTLLTDKNQSIPVQLERNGLRSVIGGRGRSPYLEMRVTTNADVKIGDVLVTSGIDGVYPEGLQVAKVALVENKATTTFETILCIPAAGLDRHKQLLVLLVDVAQLTPPESEDVRAKKEKLNRKVTRDAPKEVGKELDKEADKEAAPIAPIPARAPASVPERTESAASLAISSTASSVQATNPSGILPNTPREKR